MKNSRVVAIFCEEILERVQEDAFFLERELTNEELEERVRERVRAMLRAGARVIDHTHLRAVATKKK